MTQPVMPLDLPDAAKDEPKSAAPQPAPAENKNTEAKPLPANNKRAHHRIVTHLPYALMLKTANGEEIRFNGYTEDISVGGVSVGSSVSLALQALVAIRIDLFCDGRSDRIVAMAKCIHQSYSKSLGGFRQGFQFVNLSQKSHEAIAHFVRSRTPA